MPNDPLSLRLDEMDFSDVGDSYEDMKTHAGKKTSTSRICMTEIRKPPRKLRTYATPHVFIFDKDRNYATTAGLTTRKNSPNTDSNDARDAVEALLNNREIAVQTTKVFGCPSNGRIKKLCRVAGKMGKEPVSVDMIDVAGLKELMKNPSDKLRLIDLWRPGAARARQNFRNSFHEPDVS